LRGGHTIKRVNCTANRNGKKKRKHKQGEKKTTEKPIKKETEICVFTKHLVRRVNARTSLGVGGLKTDKKKEKKEL